MRGAVLLLRPAGSWPSAAERLLLLRPAIETWLLRLRMTRLTTTSAAQESILGWKRRVVPVLAVGRGQGWVLRTRLREARSGLGRRTLQLGVLWLSGQVLPVHDLVSHSGLDARGHGGNRRSFLFGRRDRR